MSTNWQAQLAPEHAPAPPGWWPPAPGWWGLAGLVLLLLIVGWITWRQWATPSSARSKRAALAELQRIRAGSNGVNLTACAVENVLRRYALMRYGVERVGGLSGESWLRFMQAHSGEPWSGELGASLLRAAFGSGAVPDQRERWLEAAEHFIRRSRGAEDRRAVA